MDTDSYWESQRTSFGALAADYDAYRPNWPAATAAWLTGTEPEGPLAANGPLDVLDLGAGTGKLTRTLVGAGHRVTALDPSEGMIGVLAAALPQVHAVTGAAEQLPFGDGEFDAVTVAQAWHWVDHDVAAAECARVLRPGGLLAMGWHDRAVDGEPWLQELQALTGEVEYRRRVESRRRSELELPPPFGPMQSITFDYELQLTPETLARVASTWSYVATHDDRDRVLADIEQLGRRVADDTGKLVLPHVTYCYRARREGAASGG
jgi:ubiquinone/menaquinone biosynthesis C-methylase UbiE